MPFLFHFYDVFRAFREDRLRSHKTGSFVNNTLSTLPTAVKSLTQLFSRASEWGEEEAPPRNMVIKVLRPLNEPEWWISADPIEPPTNRLIGVMVWLWGRIKDCVPLTCIYSPALISIDSWVISTDGWGDGFQRKWLNLTRRLLWIDMEPNKFAAAVSRRKRRRMRINWWRC